MELTFIMTHSLCKKWDDLWNSLITRVWEGDGDTMSEEQQRVWHLGSAFHWLLQTHLTPGRYDWQPVVHVITDQVTDAFKAMVFGTNLQKERESIKQKSKTACLNKNYL